MSMRTDSIYFVKHAFLVFNPKVWSVFLVLLRMRQIFAVCNLIQLPAMCRGEDACAGSACLENATQQTNPIKANDKLPWHL